MRKCNFNRLLDAFSCKWASTSPFSVRIRTHKWMTDRENHYNYDSVARKQRRHLIHLFCLFLSQFMCAGIEIGVLTYCASDRRRNEFFSIRFRNQIQRITMRYSLHKPKALWEQTCEYVSLEWVRFQMEIYFNGYSSGLRHSCELLICINIP